MTWESTKYSWVRNNLPCITKNLSFCPCTYIKTAFFFIVHLTLFPFFSFFWIRQEVWSYSFAVLWSGHTISHIHYQGRKQRWDLFKAMLEFITPFAARGAWSYMLCFDLILKNKVKRTHLLTIQTIIHSNPIEQSNTKFRSLLVCLLAFLSLSFLSFLSFFFLFPSSFSSFLLFLSFFLSFLPFFLSVFYPSFFQYFAKWNLWCFATCNVVFLELKRSNIYWQHCAWH